MLRDIEQRRFARHYKLKLSVVRDLWKQYSRRPADYRRVIEVDGDAKTVKGRKKGYLTGIVYFAPADSSGYEVCASRTEGCTLACLGFQGRAKLFDSIQEARIRKTHRFYQEHDAFMASMLHDAFRLLRTAARRNLIPCVRPNGTSDLPKMAWPIAAAFPFLQVYDYTKHRNPWLRTRENYHLTFSYTGLNLAECLAALEHGVNVAVVFAKGQSLPETWNGYRVIDGDDTDLRFLDSDGVIVGLTAKGNSAQLDTTNSFVILQ